MNGHINGGVLYMAGLMSVLASFDRVHVTALSLECWHPSNITGLRQNLIPSNVDRVDMGDTRYDFVRKLRSTQRFANLCRGSSPFVVDQFHVSVVHLFMRELSLDVLVVRSQRLLNAQRVDTRLPRFMAQLGSSDNELAGRAWIVVMNSFLIDPNMFPVQLANWTGARQHLLFQERPQALVAESVVGSSNVLWMPSITQATALAARAKMHPRGSRPLTVCYIGSCVGNKYLNNDLVLGFAAALRKLRGLLGRDAIEMVLVESTPQWRTLPLTKALLDGIEYHGGAISHAEAMRLYETRCDLGVRGNLERHAGGLATKVVEMAAFGIPTVVNPIDVNVDMLGTDYPYYWPYNNSVKALTALLVRAATDADEFDSTAVQTLRAVAPFTFASNRARIAPWIEGALAVSVAIVVGVRPNIVKAAAIVGAMRRRGHMFDIDLIHSGQHMLSGMSDELFADVGLEEPHWRISAPPNRTLLPRETQISQMTDEIEARLRVKRSRFVLVLGDVTTTVAAARAGRRVGATVVHYEGGLRCTHLSMPEERNRREADLLSNVVLTTEESANANLAREPTMQDKEVVFVGNVMVDTIVARRNASRLSGALAQFDVRRREFVVVTTHRQANVDDPVVLEQVVRVLEACAAAGFKLLFAAHPRTSSKIDQAGLRSRVDGLVDAGVVDVGALSYVKFLALLDAASAVLTDSGGVQEESSFLGVPCVTLRNDTERPITVHRGTNVLAPIDKPEVVVSLLRSQIDKWSNAMPPRIELWDGRASERIADWFLKAVKRQT